MTLAFIHHLFFLNAWHNDYACTQGETQGDGPGVSASRTYAGDRSDDGGWRAGAQEHGGTASCAANNERLNASSQQIYQNVSCQA